MNPVVHFELPAGDKERMKKFYTKAFGWEMNQLGEDMGNYVVVMTTEENKETKMPKMPGAINGGIYQKTKEMGDMHPSVVVAVDDINKHMKIVADAGGKIIGEAMDIPGVGSFVAFIDTEGNRLAMLQPLPRK